MRDALSAPRAPAPRIGGHGSKAAGTLVRKHGKLHCQKSLTMYLIWCFTRTIVHPETPTIASGGTAETQDGRTRGAIVKTRNASADTTMGPGNAA